MGIGERNKANFRDMLAERTFQVVFVGGKTTEKASCPEDKPDKAVHYSWQADYCYTLIRESKRPARCCFGPNGIRLTISG